MRVIETYFDMQNTNKEHKEPTESKLASLVVDDVKVSDVKLDW